VIGALSKLADTCLWEMMKADLDRFERKLIEIETDLEIGRFFEITLQEVNESD